MAAPPRPALPEKHGASSPGASPTASHGRRDVDARAKRDDEATLDPLDPLARRAAQLAPPGGLTPLAPAPPMHVETGPAPTARVSMEELVPQLVRRIAWTGDRRKGTVQLELGAGRYAGTTVTVHADEGRVRVEVRGDEAGELRARIDERLKRLGVDVESVC